jgi:hypothetical protein
MATAINIINKHQSLGAYYGDISYEVQDSENINATETCKSKTRKRTGKKAPGKILSEKAFYQFSYKGKMATIQGMEYR